VEVRKGKLKSSRKKRGGAIVLTKRKGQHSGRRGSRDLKKEEKREISRGGIFALEGIRRIGQP